MPTTRAQSQTASGSAGPSSPATPFSPLRRATRSVSRTPLHHHLSADELAQQEAAAILQTPTRVSESSSTADVGGVGSSTRSRSGRVRELVVEVPSSRIRRTRRSIARTDESEGGEDEDDGIATGEEEASVVEEDVMEDQTQTSTAPPTATSVTGSDSRTASSTRGLDSAQVEIILKSPVISEDEQSSAAEGLLLDINENEEVGELEEEQGSDLVVRPSATSEVEYGDDESDEEEEEEEPIEEDGYGTDTTAKAASATPIPIANGLIDLPSDAEVTGSESDSDDASDSSNEESDSDGSSDSASESDSSSSVEEDEEDEDLDDEDLDRLLAAARLSAQKAGPSTIAAESSSSLQTDTEGVFGLGDENVVQLDKEERVKDAPIPTMSIPGLPTSSYNFGKPSKAGPSSKANPAEHSSGNSHINGKGKGKRRETNGEKQARGALPVVPEGLEFDGRAYERKLTKKEKAAQPKKAFASELWSTIPSARADLMPQMKRDYQALALANSLDPKRFMKGGNKSGKVPENFAIGSVIEQPRHLQATTVQRERNYRPGQLVDAVARDEGVGSYAKRKFGDLQWGRMENGRGKGWKKRSKW